MFRRRRRFSRRRRFGRRYRIARIGRGGITL